MINNYIFTITTGRSGQMTLYDILLKINKPKSLVDALILVESAGNPNAFNKKENDFNTKSFISYHDYENDEEFIEKILKIDNNNDQYVEMLSEPWFNENKIPESVLPKNVLKFIISILNTT